MRANPRGARTHTPTHTPPETVGRQGVYLDAVFAEHRFYPKSLPLRGVCAGASSTDVPAARVAPASSGASRTRIGQSAATAVPHSSHARAARTARTAWPAPT